MVNLNTLKASTIAAVSYPSARNKIVAGNFLFLSILANKESFGSNSKSNHEPRYGIILAEYNSFPEE